MRFSKILKELPFEYTVISENDFEVKDIFYNSKKVKKNSIFIALKGRNFDGHDFVLEAVKKGAKAVFVERDVIIEEDITKVIVPDTYLALSYVSKIFFGCPDDFLEIIGVTGTNGKTTVTYMLEEIFKMAGKKVAVSGTIEQRFNKMHIKTGLTTPFSKEVFYFLKKIKDKNADTVLMEVSSHSLSMKRVESVKFSAAIFTNITRDHLDFHRDFDSYLKAKLHLFDLVKTKGLAIVNIDDENGELFFNRAKENSLKCITCGMKKGAYKIADFEVSWEGISFNVKGMKKKFEIPIIGEYNIMNALSSIALSREMGLDEDVIYEALKNFKGVPGRMQKIEVNKRRWIRVIIDYAHTPDAVKQVLSNLKKLPHSRLITVFGCGGNRDREKRPVMGEYASYLSDFVFITNDNPRDEEPERIALDILLGVKRLNKENYKIVLSRDKAIKEAISMLDKGDILAILGKGHENYQIVGGNRFIFSDYSVAKNYLVERFGEVLE